MADEQMPVPGNEPKSETPTPKPPTIDELQAELQKVRDALTAANHEAAERRKKLAAFEAAEAKRAETERQRREADLSETEKLKNRLAERETALNELQAKYAEAIRRQTVERLAAQAKWGKAKRPFLKPEQAYALADLTSVTEQDGQLVGVEDALKKLADENEHLLDVPRTQPKPPALNDGSANPITDAEAKRQELLQRFPRLKI